MTPFDLSVLFFFFSVLVKICVDTYHFWMDEDDYELVDVEVKVAPKHLPAPVRRSPANPNFRTTPKPMTQVRPIPATKVMPQVARTNIHPIKRQPNVAASRTAIQHTAKKTNNIPSRRAA